MEADGRLASLCTPIPFISDGAVMPYVIAESCVDVMDRSCMEECPVDCIYEGGRKLYINPYECIDCGACEPACPVEAISQDRAVPDGQEEFAADNLRFFADPLPGRAKTACAATGLGDCAWRSMRVRWATQTVGAGSRCMTGIHAPVLFSFHMTSNATLLRVM
jgi:NAD-dependent dihydropyrimidine dehydrogenase PreA subunit